MGKKLEIINLVISLLSLILIGFLFGGISLRYQGKSVSLSEIQTQNQLEETEFNKVMRLYELAENTMEKQREIINNPDLDCINKTIFLRNQNLLNNMRNSLTRINLTSAKKYFGEMDLTVCYPEAEIGTPQSPKKLGILVVMIFVILAIFSILFFRFRKLKRR